MRESAWSVPSIRAEMLEAARLAPKFLGAASQAVAEFLLGCFNSDGGARGRSGASDLYYTVFALDSLKALGGRIPSDTVRPYLEGFGDGRGLDFVHCCCLARCWAAIGRPEAGGKSDAILSRIESHRSADGGYATASGSDTGNAYGCFLAVGAYEDFECPLPNEPGVLEFLRRAVQDDGSWSNEPGGGDLNRRTGVCAGTTTATGAAVVVLSRLRRRLAEENGTALFFDPALTARWLLDRVHPNGGFVAGPGAPVPDLLSTAVAVHALAVLGAPFGHLRESLLDFVDSLWDGRGGFRGYWGDDHVDSEYTFYALLALGHLAHCLS